MRKEQNVYEIANFSSYGSFFVFLVLNNIIEFLTQLDLFLFDLNFSGGRTSGHHFQPNWRFGQ